MNLFCYFISFQPLIMMQQLYLLQHVWLTYKFHFTIATLATLNITLKQHLFVIHQNHHSLKPLIYSLIFETQVCQKHKLSNYICKYIIVLHTLFFICNLSSCTIYYCPFFFDLVSKHLKPHWTCFLCLILVKLCVNVGENMGN
jgi:hypothetical protein